MLSLGHSFIRKLDYSEEQEEEKKEKENHQRNEQEKNLQAEINFNNKLPHSIQEDTSIQYDPLVQNEFS